MRTLEPTPELHRRLQSLPLLSAIESDRWQTLSPLVRFHALDDGDLLFRAGTQSENLYLVLDGALALHLPAVDADGPGFYLHSRAPGETAGDFAVLNGGLHIVTAIASGATSIATFPAFAFELLTGIRPDLLAHVYDQAAELSRRVVLARVFIDLFGQMEAERLNRLLDATRTRHLKSGQLLFRENDPPDGLYVVVSGRLAVTTHDRQGREVRIGEVRAPYTIGELGVLSGSPRNATVYTIRESTVAFLDLEQVDTLIAPHPEMLLSLARLVMRRSLEQARRQVETPADGNFVILPLDRRMPLRRFLQQLKRALRDAGPCLALDSRGFDTLYGKRGAAQTGFDDRFNSAIAEWLDDKENRYASMVYVTDNDWSEWTRRAVHRADRILLVANAVPDADTSLRDLERDLVRMLSHSRAKPRVELVLLHPTSTRQPRETARWLKRRRLDAFHHVRLDDRRHMSRLARRMTGRATGVVFSGGGARGYAHLGVQRALVEAGIEVDYIGGSSMGGLLGAAMAQGDSVDDITALSARFANRRALFDYTLPLVALMRSNKLTRFCREVYGTRRIEDLWIPFFCVSSDLHSGEEVLHVSGALWRAVRSTISLPGVFVPVPAGNGRLLIDGAVLNTFPVDVMYRQLGGQGFMIGVNVSQLDELSEDFDYGTELSGWKVLWSRLNPFTRRLRAPRIAETLLRSTDIKSIVRINETRAMLDVLIEPDATAFALLDFKRYLAISDIGYRTAREVLRERGLDRDRNRLVEAPSRESLAAAEHADPTSAAVASGAPVQASTGLASATVFANLVHDGNLARERHDLDRHAPDAD